jgi:hypothetical protein
MLNFFLVGAAKSGTSSIAAHLSQHPDIYIPQEKETHFFSDFIYLNKEGPWQDYLQGKHVTDYEHYLKKYFSAADNESIIGEASTDYLYFHDIVIPKIKEKYGDQLKILIMLRSPFKACVSRYKHSVRRGFETQSFSDAIQLWPSRKTKQYPWDFDYLGAFQYSSQVQAYMDNFEHVKVVFLDEYSKDPSSTYKDVLSFLNVDDSFKPNKLGNVYNASDKRTNPIIKWFRDVMTKNKYKEVKVNEFTVSGEDKKNMDLAFLTDIGRLESLLNKDLSKWKK